MLPVSDSQTEVGLGVRGMIESQVVLVGSRLWLERQGIVLETEVQDWLDQMAREGNSLVYVAIAGEFAGAIAVRDQLREEAAETVQALRDLGLQVQLLTGDRPETAQGLVTVRPVSPRDYGSGDSPGESLAPGGVTGDGIEGGLGGGWY